MKEFMRNHIITHVPVANDEACCMCREDYSTQSWNYAYGRPDVPCQVIGLQGCAHIIG